MSTMMMNILPFLSLALLLLANFKGADSLHCKRQTGCTCETDKYTIDLSHAFDYPLNISLPVIPWGAVYRYIYSCFPRYCGTCGTNTVAVCRIDENLKAYANFGLARDVKWTLYNPYSFTVSYFNPGAKSDDIDHMTSIYFTVVNDTSFTSDFHFLHEIDTKKYQILEFVATVPANKVYYYSGSKSPVPRPSTSNPPVSTKCPPVPSPSPSSSRHHAPTPLPLHSKSSPSFPLLIKSRISGANSYNDCKSYTGCKCVTDKYTIYLTNAFNYPLNISVTLPHGSAYRYLYSCFPRYCGPCGPKSVAVCQVDESKGVYPPVYSNFGLANDFVSWSRYNLYSFSVSYWTPKDNTHDGMNHMTTIYFTVVNDTSFTTEFHYIRKDEDESSKYISIELGATVPVNKVYNYHLRSKSPAPRPSTSYQKLRALSRAPLSPYLPQ